MNWLISTWMKSTANCDISELKMDALLTILSKSSCFPDQTRKLSTTVRKEVRNRWLSSNTELWTEDATQRAMSDLTQLAKLIPGALEAMNSVVSNSP